jgi:hypothetical protein
LRAGVARSQWATLDSDVGDETFGEFFTVDQRVKAISRLIESAAPKAADAAFQLLFKDRTFLLQFQDLVLRAAKEYKPKVGFSSAQLPARRLVRLPSWLRKGVFHRDRGRCQQCGSDISAFAICYIFRGSFPGVKLTAGWFNGRRFLDPISSQCSTTGGGLKSGGTTIYRKCC